MRSMRSCLAAGVLLVVCVAPILARRLEDWPYDRLLKEADLVVIARAEGTTETKDRLKDTGWDVKFLGQETTLVVRATLKGNLKGKKKVRVLHYRVPEGVLLQNGPLLVSFRSKPLSIEGKANGKQIKGKLPPPDYLLFLKARPDGRFEPVSGQVDPELSVREVQPPRKGPEERRES